MAREAYECVEELRGALDTKKAELETAETKLEQEEERLNLREELRDKIDVLSDKVDELQETASLKAEDLQAHQDQRDSLVQARENVEERHEEVETRVGFLEAHLEVLRLEGRLDELNESLETVEGVREELAKIQISEENIRALEEQKEERDRAEIELETAAAQVRLSAREDVEVTEGEDTSNLKAGEESQHLVDEPTTFSFESVLDVHVEPGGEGLADIRSRHEEAQQTYEEMLSEYGVDSLLDARNRQREKDDLSGQEERL